MDNIFGFPMTWSLAIVLAIMGLCLATTGVIALFNRVIFKMAIRNIPRRPAQTILIMVGLMLSTLIIAAALTTGDTLDYSIKRSTYQGLGEVDETISFVGAAQLEEGERPEGEVSVNNVPVPAGIADDLRAALAGNPDVEGVMPFLTFGAPAVNLEARLSEPAVIVTGFDASQVDRFGGFNDLDGNPIDVTAFQQVELDVSPALAERLAALAAEAGVSAGDLQNTNITAQQVAISEDLADNLEAEVGDTLVLFYENRPWAISVAAIAPGSILTGFAAGTVESSDLLGIAAPLPWVETVSGLQGQARFIGISNRGGVDDGDNVTDDVMPALEQAVVGLGEQGANLGINPIKQDAVKGAETFGNIFMSFFIVLGLFSVAAGILLIFLIFMMLAAERRSEMGMARAVGMKRRHLIQGFIAEGTAYDLGAALIGAAAGVGVAFAIAGVMGRLIGEFLAIQPHATFRSLVIAYALGVTVTFLTIIFASVRASRLNIVQAIRDLPEHKHPDRGRRPRWRWWHRLPRFGPRFGIYLISVPWFILECVWNVLLIGFKSFIWLLRVAAHYVGWGPPIFLLGALFMLVGSFGMFVLTSTLYSLALDVVVAIWLYRVLRGRRGLVIKGLAIIGQLLNAGSMLWTLITYAILPSEVRAIAWTDSVFWFASGLSLSVLGAALYLRRYLPERPVFTVASILMLLFWLLPSDTLAPLLPELDNGGFEMFFLSGIFMVTYATLLIMWNADLIVWLISLVGRAASRWLPAVKTAVAYPLAAKGRTGMTIAMFSLVIFSLVTLTTINKNFSELFSADEAGAGWHITVLTSPSNPVGSLANEELAGEPVAERIVAEGRIDGIAYFNAQARIPGDDEWGRIGINGMDAGFMTSSAIPLEARAAGYATDADVWAALQSGEPVAIVDSFSVSTGDDFGQDPEAFLVPEEQAPVDGVLPANVTVELRNARTGESRQFTVIGVIDSKVSTLFGLYLPEQQFTPLYGTPDFQTLYVKIDSDVTDVADQAARDIEAGLLEKGAQAESIQQLIEENSRIQNGFLNLLQGFMGLGLLVGIAALGVISFRSVVERRQQIGMLRAIGYQRNMVAASFLLESLVIAALGVLSGVVLAVILSYNLITSGDIEEGVDFEGFVVPWGTILFFVTASLVAAAIMTWIPARKASTVPIAEALRYE